VPTANMAQEEGQEPKLFLREEKIENVPQDPSLLAHSLESLGNSGGFQCIVIFDAGKPFADNLGLPNHKTVARNTCFLQVTRTFETFLPQSDADQRMVLDLESYLNLYAFFLARWPIVCSKMTAQAEAMLKKDTWVLASDNLHFIGPGCCCYSAKIAENLLFQAQTNIEVQKGKERIFLRALLNKGGETLFLPLETCCSLFAKPEAYWALSKRYKKERSSPASAQCKK